MNLSPHFTLAEMLLSQDATRAGIANIPPPEVVTNLTRLATLLEGVRLVLGGHPISISSGYRCKKLNTLIGGSRTSQHMQGLAADFICPAFGTPRQICEQLLDMDFRFDQLIFEGAWVHISLSDIDAPLRNQMQTAVFKPGHKTQYLRGLL